MLSLLARRNPFSIIPNHKIHPFLLTRFCSGSATQIPDLKTPHFNVVDYLIKSCGVSPEKAARMSKPISHLRSSENPDAVLRLLKHHGFAEAEINKLIIWQPTLLCCPQKSLDTNLRALRDIGISNAALNQIILSGPAALQLRFAVPRIQFWIQFLGGDERAIVKVFKQTRWLIGHDIAKNIVPKLSLLKTHGLSTQDLERIPLVVPQFITSSTLLIEDKLKRTEELGFQPKSKMFMYGLRAMCSVSRELLQKKMELLKSFGWTDDEFLSALQKAPGVACMSEINLGKKVNFLIGEVGCEPSYIATYPGLLSLSLEKRLRPRHLILHLLESNGILSKRGSLFTAMVLSDTMFVEKYILPHNEKVSGLHETYLNAFA